MYKIRLRSWLAIPLLLGSRVAFAAPPIAGSATMFTPPALKIVLKGDMAPVAKGDRKASSWAKACESLGRALTIGSGPWGYGIFSSYSCGVGKPAAARAEAKDAAWTLEVAPGEDGYTFTTINAKGGKESFFKTPKSEWIIEYLVHVELNDLVAMRILSDLPAMGLIEAKSINDKGLRTTRFAQRKIPAQRQLPVVAPPPRLTAFQLTVVRGTTYQPVVVGEIERLGGPKWNVTAVEKKDLSKAATLAWRVPAEVSAAVREGKNVWVHDVNGRGAQSAALDRAIAAAIAKLDEANEKGFLSKFLRGVKGLVLETAAGGYGGFRYGKQILKGDDLLTKLTLIGVVAEVRNGPLGGFRFFYDTIPDQKAVQQGVNTSIGWNRIIVGRSFGLEPGKWINRIEVTPKIGAWNFNSRILDQSSKPELPAVVEFNLKYAPSLAIELGTEWSAKSYVARLWYGLDGAGIATKLGTRSVSSNRAGLDLVWTFGRSFNLLGASVKPALMAFSMYEALSMSGAGKLTLGDSAPEDVQVDLTLVNAYAGGGFAISW
ncbi:MAG: hypothetical protein RIQ81_2210 [Pseudomonadota bacterium]